MKSQKKLHSQIALTVLALALSSVSSSATLLLTFTQENGNVVMRTSGDGVQLGGAWASDFVGSRRDRKTIKTNGIDFYEPNELAEVYTGTDTLLTDFGRSNIAATSAVGDRFIIDGTSLMALYNDGSGAVDGLAPPLGNDNNNYNPATTITWNTTDLDALFGIGTHARDTEISLWQNSTVSGADGNVSFKLSTVTAVPEPSSTALLGLSSLGLLLRRRR